MIPTIFVVKDCDLYMLKLCFYKEMLTHCELSLGARMIWSWMVSEAILAGGGIDELSSWLSSHGGKVRMDGVSYASMPIDIGISRSTFFRRMGELRDAGVYVDGMLSCPESVLRGGFFELMDDGRFVSVDEAVLYSWLYDRALWLNASIFSVSNPYMAKVLGMSVAMVRKHKTRMYECGLLEVYHPRRGGYYTGIPALYGKLGRKVRETEHKVKPVKVIFE